MTDNLIDIEINNRIAEVVSGDKRSQEIISADLKMQRTQLGRIVNKKLNPTLANICAIASHYGVRPGWVITGELPKYTKDKSGSGPDLVLIREIMGQLGGLTSNLQRLDESLATFSHPGTTPPNAEGVKPASGKKGKSA